MKNEVYELSNENDIYLFFSIGKKGVFPKVIVYEPIIENIYNLAFGDLDILTGEINDKSTSNNGDLSKILATVIHSIVLFLDKNPDSQVNFKGSTLVRTKLYQRIIVNYGDEFLKNYRIFGLESGKDVFSEVDWTKNYTEFSIIKL